MYVNKLLSTNRVRVWAVLNMCRSAVQKHFVQMCTSTCYFMPSLSAVFIIHIAFVLRERLKN